jgi:hypothetical protein
MRFRCLLLCCIFFSATSLPAQQPDIHKGLDSTTKAFHKTTNDFIRLQDSLDKARLQQNINQNERSLDSFLQEMKDRETKEKRRTYMRLGAGVILLFALFVTIARRAKSRKRS